MLKVLLRLRLNMLGSWITGITRKKGKQSKGAVIGFTALMIYALGALGFLFYHIFDTVGGAFHVFGLDWLYFALAGVFAFGLMFIGSVFTAKAQLFDARDNDLLFSLPLTGGEILISRLFMLAVIDLVLELLVLVPAAFVWSRIADFSPMGGLSFVISVFSLLLLALALAALFGWIISLITARIQGNKTLVTTLLSLVFIGVYFYCSFNMNQLLMDMAADPSGAAKSLSAVAPLYWMAKAIAEGSLQYLLLSLLVPVALFAVTYFLLSRSLLKISTVKTGTKKAAKEEKAGAAVSPKKALFLREAKRLFSCPGYLLNAGLGMFMAPIAAVVLVIKGQDLAALSAIPEFGSYFQLVLLAGICAVAFMILVTVPSVSLEAKTLWVARSLPVETRDILKAKLNLHRVVGILPLLVLSLTVVVLFRPTALNTVLILVLPALLVEFTGLVGLLSDINHPIFDWTNETQAVKSAPSALITLGVCFGTLALPVLCCLFLGDKLSPTLITVIFTVLIAAADLLLYRRLLTKGVSGYESL